MAFSAFSGLNSGRLTLIGAVSTGKWGEFGPEAGEGLRTLNVVVSGTPTTIKTLLPGY